MSLTLEMPPEFEQAIRKVVKEAYTTAIEEGRRDLSMNTEYMTKQAVMEQYNVSNNTLMTEWTSKGLPYFKIGNKVYFSRKQINSFIQQHEI